MILIRIFEYLQKKKKYLEFLRHKYHYIIRDEVKKYFFDSFILFLIYNFIISSIFLVKVLSTYSSFLKSL